MITKRREVNREKNDLTRNKKFQLEKMIMKEGKKNRGIRNVGYSQNDDRLT